MTRERITLGLILASIFAIRAIHPDQPIVENYVGRQIPTAMVARNLERGSGFLHPQLDTAPFPNLFLVEPPIYAQVVASVRPLVGLDLEPTGRLVSAAAVVLGGWGLFGLVRRREGSTVGLLALASFGIFPVMIRYGRAFQPDSLMLGCVLAGLRGWDEYEADGDRRWAVFGGFVLAIGFALKITVAWALLPFMLILRRGNFGWRIAAAEVMLIPAGLWYLYVSQGIASPGNSGSRASFDNANLWLGALSLEHWLRFETYDTLGRGLVFRSFTPVGFVLAICGLVAKGKLDRLWLGWAAGCAFSIAVLAAKWHHAYYWMVVAPLAAVGVGRSLACLAKLPKFGKPVALTLGSLLVVACLAQSASTFKTPVEWESLNEAILKLRSLTQIERPAIASEAVLYLADLKGYRLEIQPNAVRRAIGEWSKWDIDLVGTPGPLTLTDFYVRKYDESLLNNQPFPPPAILGRTIVEFNKTSMPLLVVDVGSISHEPRRRAWREAIRQRPNTKILFDEPGYLIAELQ